MPEEKFCIKIDLGSFGWNQGPKAAMKSARELQKRIIGFLEASQDEDCVRALGPDRLVVCKISVDPIHVIEIEETELLVHSEE